MVLIIAAVFAENDVKRLDAILRSVMESKLSKIMSIGSAGA